MFVFSRISFVILQWGNVGLSSLATLHL